MSVPMRPDDPAYFLLKQGRDDPYQAHQATPRAPHRESCYICRDPEFAMMGLPLCQPCLKCGGHVAADDSTCDDCGADQQELYEQSQVIP